VPSITPEQWEHVKQMYEVAAERGFEAALEMTGDEAVRREVERLLPYESNEGRDFLEESPFAVIAEASGVTEGKVFRVGAVLAERWEIVGLLGRGGMGEVYHALDHELEEHVALKTLRDGDSHSGPALDRFRAEIRLARKIGHPNICKVYDLFTLESEGRKQIRFVTMELLSGETLASRLEKGPLPPTEALRIAREIIGGLDAAHRKGIVHSDLKTANVMLASEPGGPDRVVITDFGLARLLLSVSRPGAEAQGGTPGYMAPEQWVASNLSCATDIYALGVVFFEMLTGKKPFGAELSTGMLERQHNVEIQDLSALRSGVGWRWEPVIRRCLEPDPHRRFQTARDVLEALDPNSRSLWRRPRTWAAAAAAVALAIPVSFWVPGHSSRDEARSLVVMPFDSAHDAGATHFASGLTDELIGSLTRVPGIRVLARETAGHYGSGSDPADLARQLRAGRVVRGRVELRGDEIGVWAQILEPYSQHILWTQEFHRPVNDAFALFHDVGTALAAAVEPATGGKSRQSTHQPDPEAYRLYLDARYFFNYRALDPRNGPRAAELFQQAIEKDSNFAEGYSGLVDAYLVTTRPRDWSGSHLADVLHQNAARALALDPSSPEAWATNARVLHVVDYNWSQAEQYLQRALRLQPGNASVHAKYAELLSNMGRVNEALLEMDTALDLDPLSTPIRNAKAIYLFWARRYAEAEKLLQSSSGAPQALRSLPYLGAIHLRQGKAQQALVEFRLGVEKARNDPLSRAHLAWALSKIGRVSEARDILREITAPPHDSEEPFYYAAVYAALGDRDTAFHWLGRAFQEHDVNLRLLKTHPYLDDLRSDPRFPAYLKRINLN
jgi:TolB-like protein/Tfp pilus assembly protein PilF